MQKVSNRRVGPWLALLCLAASAGTLYWAWKRVEPGVRFRAICSLARSNREKNRPWTESDREALWNHLGWFGSGRSAWLTGKFLESFASEDPDEREGAILLAASLNLLDFLQDDRYWSSPLLPKATESAHLDATGVRPLLEGRIENLARLGADPRPSTRAAFLDLVNQHSESYRNEIRTIALHDPEVSLRYKATRLIGSCVPDSEQGPIFRQLSGDPSPRVRLFALAMRAIARDPDAFQDCIALLTDPRAEIEDFERQEVLAGIQSAFPLAGRCEGTSRALRTSPESLRQAGEEWKGWFRSKDFEAFAARFLGDR